jgi:hypothetical protein
MSAEVLSFALSLKQMVLTVKDDLEIASDDYPEEEGDVDANNNSNPSWSLNRVASRCCSYGPCISF